VREQARASPGYCNGIFKGFWNSFLENGWKLVPGFKYTYNSNAKARKHPTDLVNGSHLNRSENNVNKEGNIWEYLVCQLYMDFLFQNIIEKQEHVLEDNLDNKEKQQSFHCVT